MPPRLSLSEAARSSAQPAANSTSRSPSTTRQRGAFKLSAALLLHRLLIPQLQSVAVGIAQLGAVAPEHLHRWMNKGYADGDERLVPGLDIVHLDGKRNARTFRDLPFIEKNRQVSVVAHRRRFPVGDFELYFEAQMIFVPIARFPPIVNRQRQV